MPKIINDEQIFQAINQAITEFGYGGATTHLIAERAGISEVTLFRKFSNKSSMVISALEAMAKGNDFDSAIQYSGDVRTDLRKVIKAYQTTVVIHSRFFIILLNEMKLNPELADLLNKPTTILFSIGDLIKRYQTEKILRNENPLHAVANLLGPLIFTAIINNTFPEGKTIPDQDVDNHLDFFLRARLIEE